MTVGIYCIEHISSGKKYIGKSIRVEDRLRNHRYALTADSRGQDTNRHLFNAVKKHGIDAFLFYVVEDLGDSCTAAELADRELHWIKYFNTLDREFGYNLRLDSSSQSFVHEETKKLLSVVNSGEGNPNFGNTWSQEQKQRMSEIQKARRASGVYGDEYRSKISAISKNRIAAMKADGVAFETMRRKVAQALQKANKFAQYTMQGDLVTCWDSKQDIIESNPGYKWQNIYAACNGSKPSYMGFRWRMLAKEAEVPPMIDVKSPYESDSFHIRKAVQRSKAGIPSLQDAIDRITRKGLERLIPDVVDAYNKQWLLDTNLNSM